MYQMLSYQPNSPVDGLLIYRLIELVIYGPIEGGIKSANAALIGVYRCNGFNITGMGHSRTWPVTSINSP